MGGQKPSLRRQLLNQDLKEGRGRRADVRGTSISGSEDMRWREEEGRSEVSPAGVPLRAYTGLSEMRSH